MKNKFIQLKGCLKSISINKSDIFFTIGFLFSVIFYAFSWKFMVTTNPHEVPCPLWLMIVCFTGTISFWGLYFYELVKKGYIRNTVTTWLLVFFIIWSLIGVLVQPKDFSTDVVVRTLNEGNTWVNVGIGERIIISRYISPLHKVFFLMATIVITLVFYIIFVQLSRRITSLKILVFISIIVFIFMLIVCCYSYIAEASHYLPFIKNLLSGNIEEMYNHTVCSFMAQRVPYGVCMMIAVLFALICHAITKKWYFYLIGAFFYINMIFSYCKTALALTLLAIALYLIYRLIATYKNNKRRNTIIIATLSSLFGFILVLVALSLISSGKYAPLIYKIFKSFVDNRTIQTRTYIWKNTYHLLENGWWILGRGFGTYNYMLYPMNLVNGDDVCPSHSTFNAILGAGGLPAILGYFALLACYIYAFIKCVKQDWKRTIELSIPISVLLIYSITEAVNYIILVFMFPLFLFYHILQKEKDAEASKFSWLY